MQLSDLEESSSRSKGTYSVENPVYEAETNIQQGKAEAAQCKKDEDELDSSAISQPQFDSFPDDEGVENPIYGYMFDAEQQNDDFKGRLELENSDDSDPPKRKEQYHGTLDVDNPMVEIDI